MVRGYRQSDPIGLAGGINTYAHANNNPFGLNTYAYADNNPLRYMDPLGLAPSWVSPAAVVIGATGGTITAIGIATGNAPVGLTGIALVALAGGLNIWDIATSPVDAIRDIRESDDMRTIEENMRGLEDLINERNRSLEPDCPQ